MIDNAKQFHFHNLVSLEELHKEIMASRENLRNAAEEAIREQRATFADLVALEPVLQWLMDDAIAYHKSHGKKHTRCANARWYGYGEWKGRGLKKRLTELVGFESETRKVPILLRTPYVYDLAYQEIYQKLPGCRNCSCYFP